jgi:hypothetical protein
LEFRKGVLEMGKKEYKHLIKPLRIQQPPAGLYTEPCVWMEGKDLEGFNAHFSYGFINKLGPIHPKEGALIHPYDECLIFAGIDNTDILHLGAEISIKLGEEQEEHIFNEPSVVIVPKGKPHGPVTVKSVEKTIAHYSFGLAPEYKATSIPETSKPHKTKGTTHRHLIKKLMTHVDPSRVGTGMGYEAVTDSRGVMHPAERGIGPGNGDQLVWMFGQNLEGLKVNFVWGFYSRCGKWHRGGEAHTHPEEEVLVFLGFDPNNLNYLGAELEIGMGKDYERHIFNTPTVAICPKGFPHLPIITRWVDKPYGFLAISLSEEHDSPWVET